MSLRIRSIEHVAKAREPAHYPRDRLAEVAFAGRSNVGKSSAINTLLGRQRLAKVSGTPGRTRSLDFYRVELASGSPRAFYLVDLPGYGYAKLPAHVRQAWKAMVEEYLLSSGSLVALVHILLPAFRGLLLMPKYFQGEVLKKMIVPDGSKIARSLLLKKKEMISLPLFRMWFAQSLNNC